jgi:hypothetical protein
MCEDKTSAKAKKDTRRVECVRAVTGDFWGLFGALGIRHDTRVQVVEFQCDRVKTKGVFHG